MSWSLSLGRVAGIRLYVHYTFFLLLAFFGLSDWLSTGRWEAAVAGLLLFACVAVIIVLHELGHALAARYYGIRTRDITLLPIGGVARLERMPQKPSQELVVALAGPAVNVILAAGIFLGSMLSGALIGWEALLSFEGSLLVQLFFINVWLFLFNMIPAFPMDGGRVLRALLALRMDYVKATRIAAYVGQGIAVIFAIVGLTGVLGHQNIVLVLIAVFVWSGAQAEANMVRTRAMIAGMTVGRLMATHLYAMRPDDPIAHAGDIVSGGFQQDFPVVDGRKLAGMLTKKDLLEALATRPTQTLASEVMRTDIQPVHPDDSVEVALGLFQSSDSQALPVTAENDELVGMLTIDRLGEYLAQQGLLKTRTSPRPSAGHGVKPQVDS
jgi:Zn-dependent protease/CBS domain-containing protein